MEQTDPEGEKCVTQELWSAGCDVWAFRVLLSWRNVLGLAQMLFSTLCHSSECDLCMEQNLSIRCAARPSCPPLLRASITTLKVGLGAGKPLKCWHALHSWELSSLGLLVILSKPGCPITATEGLSHHSAIDKDKIQKCVLIHWSQWVVGAVWA